MVCRPFFSVVLLALLGACAPPQPATTAGALAGAQTERFANGDVYVGQMAGGVREGQGTYTWSDGRRYVGGFRAGLQDGHGSYTYPNGEKYEGQFQANRRAGQGTYSWPDGRRYVGDFQADRPHGRGTYSWPDGKNYVGEFSSGAVVNCTGWSAVAATTAEVVAGGTSIRAVSTPVVPLGKVAKLAW